MGYPCWELVYCFSCSILQEEQEEVKLLVGLTGRGDSWFSEVGAWAGLEVDVRLYDY